MLIKIILYHGADETCASGQERVILPTPLLWILQRLQKPVAVLHPCNSCAHFYRAVAYHRPHASGKTTCSCSTKRARGTLTNTWESEEYPGFDGCSHVIFCILELDYISRCLIGRETDTAGKTMQSKRASMWSQVSFLQFWLCVPRRVDSQCRPGHPYSSQGIYPQVEQ
jgi:hypothetical protein